MASGHNDPKLLYAISGVSAYHISHGHEESLTPTGPQTLSLLMVPTSSPFADPATFDNSERVGEEDFYLHLHLPPELDIPLPATTQIYHQPPTSYLIPRWDLGPDSGAFTRLEFPSPGSRRGLQEDIDTFETILAQCTAFLERAAPPQPALGDTKKAPIDSKSKSADLFAAEPSSEQLPAYNPGDYLPGEGYAKGSASSHVGGRIVLIDEENGSVIGELGEGYDVKEESGVKPGSKAPVEISLAADGKTNQVAVAPASAETLAIELHPAYQKSTLVNRATAASRLILTTSDALGNAMISGSDTFMRKTQPVEKPLTFDANTHERVRKIGKFTGDAAALSAKTVGQVTKVAQNVGASISGRGKGKGRNKGFTEDGQMIEGYKPGLLNKSMMAFSTVADGIDQAARNIMTNASSSATTMVTHRWGDEAGGMAAHLGGGVKNVGLVYIDVAGVSRKAIVKAVGKGMVIGKVKGGGEIIVGDDAMRNSMAAGQQTPSTSQLVPDDASIMSGATKEKK